MTRGDVASGRAAYKLNAKGQGTEANENGGGKKRKNFSTDECRKCGEEGGEEAIPEEGRECRSLRVLSDCGKLRRKGYTSDSAVERAPR